MPILVFSLIIATIYSLSVLREGGVDPSGDSQEVRRSSESFMEGVRVTNTKDGKRTWLLHSKRIKIKGNSVLLEEVNAEIPGIEMGVTAYEGRYDMDSADLDLSGGVNMVGDDYTVKTREASLEPVSGEFHSRGDVVIEGGGFRISGVGLLASRQEIRVERDVKAVFY